MPSLLLECYPVAGLFSPILCRQYDVASYIYIQAVEHMHLDAKYYCHCRFVSHAFTPCAITYVYDEHMLSFIYTQFDC